MPPLSLTYTKPQIDADVKVLEGGEHYLPNSIDGTQHALADLLQEGLRGLLARNANRDAYGRSRGDGSFDEPSPLDRPSATGGGSPTYADIDGNGKMEAVTHQGAAPGTYELDGATQSWGKHEPFENALRERWADGAVAQGDLTGDQLPDAYVSTPDEVVWYESEGRTGHRAASRTSQPRGDQESPPMVGSEPGVGLYQADMTGDGLTDVVRVRNGHVAYWPNQGYGRFGRRVTMGKAPRVASSDQFDPRRLRLVDLTGTGTADLLYIGGDGVCYWYNESGNSFGSKHCLDVFPPVSRLHSLQVVDLFGDGLPCLVWSSPLPGDSGSSLRYVQLQTEPPHQLEQMENGMGKDVRISYGSSVEHYLRDRREGRSWNSALPVQQTVVDKIERIDHVGQTRTHTEYQYHDGYFDGVEREFRGFGCVETVDTEQVSEYAGLEAEDYVAPSREVTWFHPGLPPEELGQEDEWPYRAYDGDPQSGRSLTSWIENEGQLSARTRREAYRALGGEVVRKEVYGEDEDPAADLPYRVREKSAGVRVLQDRANDSHAVVHPIPSETLDRRYERTKDDPRVRHRLVLQVGPYGTEERVATVAYPRRTQHAQHEEQKHLHLTVEEQDVVHETNRFYRLRVPIASRTYEVAGVKPQNGGLFDRPGVTDAIDTARNNVRPFDDRFDNSPSSPTARLVEWTQTFYHDANGNPTRTVADTDVPVRHHHDEEARLTDPLVQDVYGSEVDAQRLRSLGYVKRNGYWWAPSPIKSYEGPEGFYLLSSETDPFGHTSQQTYDSSFLHVDSTTDKRGNTTKIEVDPYALQPRWVKDPNGNVSEMLYDPLGVLHVTSRHGQQLDDAGSLVDAGDEPLDQYQLRTAPRDMEQVLQDPHHFLQEATSFYHYDLFSWRDTRSGSQGSPQPVHRLKVNRETHVHDLEGGQTDLQFAVDYLDGWGRDVQTKKKVGAGKAQVVQSDGSVHEEQVQGRWLTTGRTIYNNKALPLKQYEPYYSATPQYLDNQALNHFGVTPVYRYDPLGRHVRTDTPKGFFSETTITPWRVETSDENDTVERSFYFQTHVQPGLVSGAEKKAIDKARQHADTPSVDLLDPLGRPFLTQEQAEKGGDLLETYRAYDALGRERVEVDPRQHEKNESRASGDEVETFERTYDMSGAEIRSVNIDRGERRQLVDAMGRRVGYWTGRGHHRQIEYDALSRKTSVQVFAPGSSAGRTVQVRTYGEDSSVANAADRNALGRLVEHRDRAGVRTVERYDQAGRPLAAERQLRSAYGKPVDWEAGQHTGLESDHYELTQSFDALGRIVQRSLPDGSVQRPQFSEGGWLEKLNVKAAGGSVDENVVAGMDRDAKGRRTQMQYGNGVRSHYTYDPQTGHLRRQRSTRPASENGSQTREPIQEIDYTYDPVGNVTRREDTTREHLFDAFPRSSSSPAHSEYTYDALYRLEEATGWVHKGLLEHDYAADTSPPDPVKGTRFASLNDGQALERYTRTYDYDAAGNRTEMKHIGASQSWTAEMWVDDKSNRSTTKTRRDGIDRQNPAALFDADGNRSQLDHVAEIEWDDRNRMRRAVIDDTVVNGRPKHAVYFVYASSGSRMRKVEERVRSGVRRVTETIYLGDCEIKRQYKEERTVFERKTSHVGDGEEVVASVHHWTVDDLGRETDRPGSAKIHYRLRDQQNTTTLHLDSQAQVISYEEHFPFGGSSFLTGRKMQEVRSRAHRYMGKERDDVTGLYYFGQRYYASWIGRWMSPDPAGAVDGLNLYAFVRNNPVGRVDPSGLNSEANDFQRRVQQQAVPVSRLPEGLQDEVDVKELKEEGKAYYFAASQQKDEFKTAESFEQLHKFAQEHDVPIRKFDPQAESIREFAEEQGAGKTIGEALASSDEVYTASDVEGGLKGDAESDTASRGESGSAESQDKKSSKSETSSGTDRSGGQESENQSDSSSSGGEQSEEQRKSKSQPGNQESGQGPEDTWMPRVDRPPEYDKGEALDDLQTFLDVVGLVPGLGEPADALNALVSLSRGNYGDAALSGAAMIPFAGWFGTGAKFGKKAGVDDAVAKAIKESGEEGGGKAVKEGLEEGSGKAVREGTEAGSDVRRAGKKGEGTSGKGVEEGSDINEERLRKLRKRREQGREPSERLKRLHELSKRDDIPWVAGDKELYEAAQDAKGPGLSREWRNFRSRLGNRLEKRGRDVKGKPFHHWKKKSRYPDKADDPENLYLTPNEEVHKEGFHRAQDRVLNRETAPGMSDSATRDLFNGMSESKPMSDIRKQLQREDPTLRDPDPINPNRENVRDLDNIDRALENW
ncbi:toxin TcdB middle/N-terminal domain-containing protein [Salinibacter sp. 10B]|uniref:toxin TcdB middle/N-terminal domain-containing protein n=1 Tax=Salinibacter sp. 10B TaxID=1923971 RepID=UPI002157B801|nr:toxin TcdB middle/N-terminal domain-containing protein [Salinibacter sp. 10B]